MVVARADVELVGAAVLASSTLKPPESGGGVMLRQPIVESQ